MINRTGFVGNSSSSSFLIVMDNNQLKKFEQCFDDYFITYEKKIVITNCDSLCDFLMVDGSVFKTFKSFHYDEKNNDIVFNQFSKVEWFEQIDYLLQDFKTRLNERRTMNVHPDFVTMETNYVNHLKNCIENLEKLRNQDPNDLSFRSRDEENYIRNEFDNRKKDLEEGNDIIYLVLRRDGECPDSQIENKLATDNNLETFLLDQGFVFKSFRQEY